VDDELVSGICELDLLLVGATRHLGCLANDPHLGSLVQGCGHQWSCWGLQKLAAGIFPGMEDGGIKRVHLKCVGKLAKTCELEKRKIRITPSFKPLKVRAAFRRTRVQG
jgi:hypothetical protein